MPKEKLKLNICHMYPDLLNLYGDRGNVFSLARRCQWRGIKAEVHRLEIGGSLDLSAMDIIFLGGGSDREQNLMAGDLSSRAAELAGAFEDGLVALAICGGYQLLGSHYRTLAGEIIPGLGILDLYTEGGEKRLIGNVAVEIDLGGVPHRITGFENHSGRTFLGDIQPLGRVLAGFGNNGSDGAEGARYRNVFCTYLHGPILPKNPALADHLIALALERKHPGVVLESLDDGLENSANEVMLRRLLGNPGNAMK